MEYACLLACIQTPSFKHTAVTHLEYHFNREDTSEDVIEAVEDPVSVRKFEDWILSRQRYAARTDDYHDEQIEVSKIHYEVAESTQTADIIKTHYLLTSYTIEECII